MSACVCPAGARVHRRKDRRVGQSLLSNMGLGVLVTHTAKEFVAAAGARRYRVTKALAWCVRGAVATPALVLAERRDLASLTGIVHHRTAGLARRRCLSESCSPPCKTTTRAAGAAPAPGPHRRLAAVGAPVRHAALHGQHGAGHAHDVGGAPVRADAAPRAAAVRARAGRRVSPLRGAVTRGLCLRPHGPPSIVLSGTSTPFRLAVVRR